MKKSDKHTVGGILVWAAFVLLGLSTILISLKLWIVTLMVFIVGALFLV